MTILFSVDTITAWMRSATMTSWTSTPAWRLLRDTKPVSVWRTRAVILDFTGDTPALLTLRYKHTHVILLLHSKRLCDFLLYFEWSDFVVVFEGSESRLPWYIRSQHWLPVDWHHRRRSWKLHPEGVKAWIKFPRMETPTYWYSFIKKIMLDLFFYRSPSIQTFWSQSQISRIMLCAVKSFTVAFTSKHETAF